MQDKQLVPLGWVGILRLGLVQAALGAIVVLTTSTLNRVMVVELALPAMLPGILVSWYHALQMMRPRFGYGSDVGGRRTPWIVGGMAVLALGGLLAATAVAWMDSSLFLGVGLAVIGFTLIGFGLGAAGTNLLVLLAGRVSAERRAPAAMIVWVMMIIGFIITAKLAGHFLDPFSLGRLVAVTGVVSLVAFVVAVLALGRLEYGQRVAPGPSEPIDLETTALGGVGSAGAPAVSSADTSSERPGFRAALAQVWAEPAARHFTIFVFIAMLAYSGQDLILEPFAGTVFGLTPGESTSLAGTQNQGLLFGMILIAIMGRWGGPGALRTWTVIGCVTSAAALMSLVVGGALAPNWPLELSVLALGVANGAFAVGAIGSMMALVSHGRERREGVRMGLWGAAQAIAMGLGGFLGTVAIDLTRVIFASPVPAYTSVFAVEALLFLIAARLAAQVTLPGHREGPRAGTTRPASGPRPLQPAYAVQSGSGGLPQGEPNV